MHKTKFVGSRYLETVKTIGLAMIIVMFICSARAMAGWATIRGGTLQEPAFSLNGGVYNLAGGIFFRRGDSGWDAKHFWISGGFDPERGISKTSPPFYRFLLRPLCVLDGRIVDSKDLLKPRIKLRRTYHNLGCRALEAFSANASALDPAKAAMVFGLYTFEPPTQATNFRAPVFRVFRIEFQDGKPERGWTLFNDHQKSSDVFEEANRIIGTPDSPQRVDVGELFLEDSQVTGTIRLTETENEETYHLDFRILGAAVAGRFTGIGNQAKTSGGIIGDLDWGHADLKTLPTYEIMIAQAVGPEIRDDLILRFVEKNGSCCDVHLRDFAGERKIEVIEHYLGVSHLEQPG